MNIRTKLHIGSIIIGLSMSLFMVLTVFLFFTQRYLYQKGQIAQQITENAFQLSALRAEYVSHPGERPKTQWVYTYEKLIRLLDESSSVFIYPEEKELFEKIKQSSNDSGFLFGKLVKNIEINANETVIQELVNQMVVKAQTRLENGIALSELSQKKAVNVASASAIFMVILGLIIVLLAMFSYFSTAKIINSIRLLGEGTKIIAKGEYSYYLNVQSTDEIGDLARLFNVMAKKLQKMYTEMDRKIIAKTKDLAGKVEEIEKVNKFLTTIFENIPNMIFLKDAKDLRFVRMNKAGEELLGVKRNDLFGKNDFDFFSAQEANFFIEKDREVLSHSKLLDIPEEQIETKSKGKRWLHTKKIPLMDSNGKPEYLLGISEDITDRLQIDKVKSDFITLASHQLRTPLTEIRWALSSLKKQRLGKDQKHVVESAHKAVLHMVDTINSMLTLSHIETGEIQLQPENVPLKELLTSAVDLQEIHRQKKSLKVIVQCPANLRLTTDSKILNEIISNLISNAYKYSLQGGGVQVVAKKIDKKIHIIITDTGLGIPEDEQSRLFTKFFRASNVIDKKEEGSGIGLYMVYSLVKILGGTISYDSEENKGTTFTLIFSSTAL